MADEEVAAGKGFGADVAYEGLFLGVCPSGALSAESGGEGGRRGMPDVPLEMLEAREEALAVGTWQRLGLCSRWFSLDAAARGGLGGIHLVRRGKPYRASAPFLGLRRLWRGGELPSISG